MVYGLFYYLLLRAGNRVSPVGGCALCCPPNISVGTTDVFAKELRDQSGSVPGSPEAFRQPKYHSWYWYEYRSAYCSSGNITGTVPTVPGIFQETYLCTKTNLHALQTCQEPLCGLCHAWWTVVNASYDNQSQLHTWCSSIYQYVLKYAVFLLLVQSIEIRELLRYEIANETCRVRTVCDYLQCPECSNLILLLDAGAQSFMKSIKSQFDLVQLN